MKPMLKFFTALLPALLAGVAFAAESPTNRPQGKAPFRMLFSNDTTNILSCLSPYHGPDDRALTDAMIRASVDEAAVPGMGAQLLQPGMSWVPWWPSKVVPLKSHLAWFERHYGVAPSGAFTDYLRNGGDMVKVFTEQVHKNKEAAFISFRLNDVHALDQAFLKTPNHGRYAVSFAQFYVENPQFRIGNIEEKSVASRVQNWLHPEVRDYKFRIIEEVCQNYPVDGIELDFMRWFGYFPRGTDAAQAKEIMADFVARVRKMLDATSREGKYRWLSVRIPASPEQWPDLGIDPKAFYEAGADIFNLSNSYCMTQQNPVALVRSLAPASTIVVELTNTVATWKVTAGGGDNANLRRATKQMLENTARLAYARGADGVSFFNFVYYRPFGSAREKRGPFDEPPFDVLPSLASAEGVKNAPPYYFYATNADGGQMKGRELLMKSGDNHSFTMDMLPLPRGQAGRLRVQIVTEVEKPMGEGEFDETADRGQWRVRVNGRELRPDPSAGEVYPFNTDIRAGFGEIEQYRAYVIPPDLVKDGLNQIDVWYASGSQPMYLRFVDVALK